MRSAFRIMAAASILLAANLVAQVATTAAPAPPPAKPTFAQLGLIIYPAKQQTPEQQALDEEACYTWAETQTGIHLSAGPVNTDSAAQAAAARTSEATQGAAVAGAARGAAGGAIIGAIAGDAGTGAAIGAVAGAARGRRARKRATAQAGAQGAQQAEAQNQQMVDQFKKAGAVCLEGRGYTAK
ncbi:MAG: hypothetical protein OEY20_05130 [Gemmatimonadota bacterium]|nr:hypothetical protein [Gemmatimonadota bacterium]MDH4351646.1 hypothetical protein [Gemmatimonadota bacterium]MDH5196612.1 hypothetical protein [Gemmatimonadota bacterium]